jgi:glycosyltransferase involved in cell wall biosynthesis
VPRKGGEKRQFSLLHLITTLDVGGAEMSLLNLISRMDGTRFKNHVICLAEMGPLGEKISACGIPVNALNMPRGRLTVGGLVKLFGLIRQINPDILQTWMYHADLIGLLFGRIFRVRPICWNIRCSNMDLVKYRWATVITVKLCAILSSLPNVIIANSREGANFHERIGYRGKRWEVIPNGFDLRVFQPDGQAKERLAMELGLDPKDLPVFIGYIARFDPMKDHQTFLDAASRLLVGRRDVHFILAGRNVDQDNREISDRVPKALEEHFHLLGERDDAEKITAGLDIACSVSLGEGFSNAVGEAMACGVPCVVTDVGDSAFIVGETGAVVQPRDREGLLSAWRHLLDLGRDGRAELGKAARRRIKEHFDISEIVGRYEDLYTSLMD